MTGPRSRPVAVTRPAGGASRGAGTGAGRHAGRIRSEPAGGVPCSLTMVDRGVSLRWLSLAGEVNRQPAQRVVIVLGQVSFAAACRVQVGDDLGDLDDLGI